MSTNDKTPAVARRLSDGTIIELLFDPSISTTCFAVAAPGAEPAIVDHVDLPNGERLVPYSATNDLIASGCVLLPSEIGELGDERDLVDDIRRYLARYVALSPAFLQLAPYYVLLSWAYDAFREMPACRFRGDWGTGKTRALITLGSICYRPFFASGASTVSPIFHILDSFKATLVLDEADFAYSEKSNDIVKILNNGTVDGLPVLRTMTNRHRELNPKAFKVFGPKVVAMRESFADRALESRFITEETSKRTLPPHIPIHTPDSLGQEALELRNRLLAWRLKTLPTIAPDATVTVAGADNRTNQMALPLLSLVRDPEERASIMRWFQGEHARADQRYRDTTEGRVLAAVVEALSHCMSPSIPIADVTVQYNASLIARGEPSATNKWIGGVVRERLGLSTRKTGGIYVIPENERTRIRALADRLGNPHDYPQNVSSPDTVAEVHTCTAGG